MAQRPWQRPAGDGGVPRTPSRAPFTAEVAPGVRAHVAENDLDAGGRRARCWIGSAEAR